MIYLYNKVQEEEKPLDENDYDLGDKINLSAQLKDRNQNIINNKTIVFEGNILLTSTQKAIMDKETEEQNEKLRAATSYVHYMWPRVGSKFVIPYTISNDFSTEERDIISLGFNDYKQNTCIRYVKVNYYHN